MTFFSPRRTAAFFNLLIAIVLIGFSSRAKATVQVIYVNKNSPAATQYGTNWATAYKELSSALVDSRVYSATTENPVQIWVAKGTYKPTTTAADSRKATFAVPSNVAIMGSFAGTEITGNEPRYANNLTILSGDIGAAMTNKISENFYPPKIYNTNFAFEPGFLDNAYNVVTVTSASNVFLQNLVIVNGNADAASIIGVTNAVQDMMTPDPGDNPGRAKRPLDSYVAGGGLFGHDCTITMVQVEFINNFAVIGGGVALGENHFVYGDQCAFLGNYAPSGGGAMFELAPDSLMQKCDYYFNRSDTEAGAIKYLSFHRIKDAEMTDRQKAMSRMVGTFQSKAAAVGLGDADQIARTRLGGMIAQLAVSTLKKTIMGSGEIDVQSKGSKAGMALMAYTLGIDILLATLPDGTAREVVEVLHKYTTIDGYLGMLQEQIARFAEYINDEFTNEDEKARQAALATKRVFKDGYPLTTDGTLLHCKFVQNDAEVGGAVMVNHANVNFESCLFQENTAGYMAGAAFTTTLNVPKFVNCVFYKNHSDLGFSAVANAMQSRAQIINCTFLQNSSLSKEVGQAIGNTMGSDVRIVNTIMWSNSTPALVDGGADVFSATATHVGPSMYSMAGADKFQLIAITEIRNSCLQGLTNIVEGRDEITPGCFSDRPGDDISFCFTPEGGAINMGEGCRPGTKTRYGNISVYPGFSEDFRVFNGSPTLDAGDMTLWNLGVATTGHREDFHGQARVQYGKIDMGATEGAGYSSHLYVKPGGSGNQNGSSWTNAMSSLAAAMRAGSSEIWVAAGTYYPTASGDRGATFVITNNMSIYGGFTGTETELSQRNPTNNVTILSGDIGTPGIDSDNSYRVLYLDSHVSYWTVIDGFTITKGRGTDSAAGNSSGGGAQCWSASPRFQNCKFIDNLANRGGAIYATGIEGPTFLNCQFLDNTGTSGGAIYAGSRLQMDNCSLIRNTATEGGAIDIRSGQYAYLYNCLFTSNSVSGTNFVFGSAIFSGSGDCSVENCTFYRNNGATPNVSLSNNGAAVYFQGSGGRTNLSIRNSVFWKNSATNTIGSQLTLERQQISYNTSASVYLKNNLIEGLTTLTDYDDFDRDPFFVNTSTGDLHLAAYSPLVNSGSTNGYNLNTDLDGNVRVVGTNIDIGAYEFQSTATPVVARVYKQRSCDPGGTIQSFVFDTGTNNYGFTTYQWEVNRNDGLGFRTLSSDSVHSNVTTATLTFVRPPTSLNGFRYRIRASGPTYSYVSSSLVLSAAAPIVYVRANATGNNTGTDWTNAYTSLQSAIGVPDSWDVYQNYAAGTQIIDNGVRYRALVGHDSTYANRPPETNTWSEVLVDECSQIWVAAGTYYVSNDVSVAVNRYNVAFTNVLTYDNGYTYTNVVTTLVSGSTNHIPGNNFKVLGLFDVVNKTTIGALRLRSNLRVYGGFSGTETNFAQRNWRTNQTIISGNVGSQTSDTDNADRLFYNDGVQVGYAADSTAVLDGFTLTKARSSAIYNRAVSPLIQNCTFLNNNGANGGAIYNTDSASPAFMNCIFSGNTAGDGGAVYNASSAAFSATNCVFNRNIARYRGGALFNAGTMNLVNCVVANNSSEISGGGLLAYKSAKILNSIFWNNQVIGGSSLATVETRQIDRYFTTNNVVVSNSCVQGLAFYAGNGNIPYDPLFVNASAADYRLDAASPAVNAGDSNFVKISSLDLAGNARIYNNGIVDMGAYELQASAVPTALFYSTPESISSCSVGGSAFFALTATSDGSRTFVWQKSGVSGFTNLTTDATYIITSTATNTTLTIQNVSAAMSGSQFRVIEQNSHYTSAPVTLYLTAPSVIYVNAANVSGAHTGGSWATALTDVQSALALANSCSEIWVAKGTYTNAQPLVLKSGVSIFGGFSGAETTRAQRNWTLNPVYLRGMNNDIVFNNFSLEANDHTAVLDGFTIQAPAGKYAIFNDGVSPTYRNCTFEKNAGYYAVYNNRSSAVYSDCLFRSNSCPSIGNFASSSRITGCTFTKNTITGHGMIQNSDSSAIIDRCVFSGNSADGGAGVYNDVGSLTQISDSLFVRNIARTFRGGAIEDYSKGLTLLNCTITENTALYESGGVYLQQATANIANCIFWKNTVSSVSPGYSTVERAQIDVYPVAGLSAVVVSNSCIQGLSIFGGNNNISFDPLFANPVIADYHLANGSAAINSGNTNAAVALSLDLDGNPRAVGIVDLGAYERQSGSSGGVQLLSLPEYQAACSGQSVNFTVSTLGLMTNIQWQVDSNGYGAVVTNDGNHSIVTSGNSSTLSIAAVSTGMNNRQYRFILPGANYTSAPVTLTVSASSIVYVKPSAGSSGVGTSWGSAFTNLSQAMAVADQCTEIWVAAGTCVINSGAVQLKPGVRIYGGFTGNETTRNQRNWQINTSVLSGIGSPVIDNDGSKQAVDLTTILDGFTITSPFSQVGIRNNFSSFSIQNCTFTNCSPALYNLNGANPAVSNCVFIKNVGAVWNVASAPVFNDCQFLTNNSDAAGGAISNSVSQPSFNRCVFVGNTASQQGGAIYDDANSTITLRNCLLRDNMSYSYGGAIDHNGPNLLMLNSTAFRNYAAFGGGGLRVSSGVGFVANSILWKNTVGISATAELAQIKAENATIVVSNSCVHGLTAYAGSNNIPFDPLFTDEVGGDLHLTAFSPALNAGNNALTDSSLDLDRSNRTFGGTVDIGAYERQAAASGVVRLYALSQVASVCTGHQVTFSLSGTNIVGSNFVWQVNVFGNGTNYTTVTNGGSYAVIVTSNSSTLLIPDVGYNMQFNKYRVTDTVSGFVSSPFTFHAANPTILRVRAGATGAGNGMDWSNAFTNLNDAFAAASGCAEIWVAAGTYTGATLNVSPNLQVFGGFNGTEVARGQRNRTLNPTIVQQTIQTTTNYGSVDAGTLIDGFNFTGGGHIENIAASPTIRNCVFEGLSVYAINNIRSAAVIDSCLFTNNLTSAIRNAGASSYITNCVFTGNVSTNGAGVYNSYSTPTIVDCTFRANRAASGAALWNSFSSPVVDRSVFKGNMEGGAIFTAGSDSAAAFYNCSFFNNVSESYGGAIAHFGGTLKLVNCTVTLNTGAGAGGGIYAIAPFTIANSILWNNALTLPDKLLTLEQYQIQTNGTSGTISNSCVQGLSAYAGNNIAYDPLLADAGNGDLHLGDYSPAINAGNSSALNGFNLDLDRQNRTFGPAVDLGAFERQSNALGLVQLYSTPISQSACVQRTVAFTVSGTNGSGATFQWQVLSNGNYIAVTNDSQTTISVSSNSSTLTLIPTSVYTKYYRIALTGSGFIPSYFTFSSTQPTILYVNPKALNSGAGNSWASAFRTVQEAFPISDECTEIWVAAGTNAATSGSISLKSGVQLYGGFSGTESSRSQRNWTNNVTVLLGSATAPVINNVGNRMPIVRSAVVDGFTIRGQNNEVGVHNYAASPTIRNCTFSGFTGPAIWNNISSSALIDNCTFATNDATVTGFAVIYSFNASPVITNCLFVGNRGLFTGAIENNSSAAAIGSCRFVRNSSDYFAGAIWNEGNSISTIVNSQFLTNSTAGDGGAIYNSDDASVTIGSSLFIGNSARQAGAISHGSTGTCSLVNSTLYANQAAVTYSGGGIIQYRGTFNIRNSILWRNRDQSVAQNIEQAQFATHGGTAAISSSCIENLTTYAGNGNLQFDPLFVDPDSLNFRLSSYSPLVNQGNNNYVVTSADLDNNSRVFATTVDMGAYELQTAASTPVQLTATPTSQLTCNGHIARFTASGLPATMSAVVWQVYSNGQFFNISNGSTYSIATTTTNSVLTISNALPSMASLKYRIAINGASYTSALASLNFGVTDVIYVKATAPAGGNGLSWATAYQDLASAIAAGDSCSEIWVAQGTYTPSTALSLKSGLAIYGGFVGNEALRSQRNWDRSIVLLQRSGYLFNNYGGDVAIDRSAVLDGVYLTSTGTNGAAAMLNQQASPTIRNCTIANCVDGGIRNEAGSSPLIQSCTFTSNKWEGVSSVNSSPVISDCAFINNQYIAVENNLGATSTIVKCIFAGNVSRTGTGAAVRDITTRSSIGNCIFSNNLSGAFSTVSSTSVVYNCTFQGNSSSSSGGAVFVQGSALSLVNSTVVENSSGSGGGLFNGGSGSSINIKNCIFWDNRHQSLFQDFEAAQIFDDFGTPVVENSIVKGLNRFNGSGNLGFDPLFVNVSAGDLRLFSDSPAVNTGNNGVVTNIATDLSGNIRVREATVDMGAYELTVPKSGVKQLPIGGSTSACAGGNFLFTVNGPAQTPGLYGGIGVIWQLDTGSGFSNIVTNGTYRVSTNGVYSTLQIVNATAAMNGHRIRFALTATNTYNSIYFYSPASTLSVSSGSVVYVNAAASAGGDGLSWATAFRDLTSALQFNGCASEVWVAAGTYYPTAGSARSASLHLSPGTAIYGGFAGTETTRAQRNWNSNPTIISGDIGAFGDSSDNSFNVVTADGLQSAMTTNTVLDGVIIENGAVGLNIYHADITVRNCVIRNTWSTGAMITEANPVLAGCLFTGNSGDTGGGLYTALGSPTLINCQFSGNSATYGGGIYVLQGSPRLYNCLITGNASTLMGGGMDNDFASPVLINCTISCNSSGSQYGGGGGIGGQVSLVAMTNCIVWNNRSTGTNLERSQIYNINGTNRASDSCIEGLSSLAGNNNTAIDPRFVLEIDPTSAPSIAGNFHLQDCSPLINVGNNTPLSGVITDLDGSLRIYATNVDVGAYELQLVPASTVTLLQDPASFVYCSTASNYFGVVASGSGLTYQWEVNTGSTFSTLSDDSIHSGTATPTLVITNAPASLNGAVYRCRISSSLGCTFHSRRATLTVRPSRLYVSASAAPGGDGLSWAMALTDLNGALSATADSCKLEIWVQAGTYIAPSSGFRLKNHVGIYGGFAGTETNLSQRNWAANPTILSGTGTWTVYNDGQTTAIDNSAILDGCIVQNGSEGIFNFQNASPLIANCVIRSNSASGIYNLNSSPTILGCVLENNGSLSQQGGGMYNSGSSPKITNCVFRGNIADSGGAMRNTSSQPRIENCVFSGNYSTSLGGAIYNSFSGTVIIRNSTFTGNRTANGTGAAAIFTDTAMELYNSIVWNNVAGTSSNELAQIYVNNTSMTVYNTCFQGFTNSNYKFRNNVDIDPQFYSPINAFTAPTTNGNFHLLECSSLINAGTNTYVGNSSTDLDGNPRISDNTVDMGAYEATYAPTAVVITLQPVSFSYCNASTSNQFKVAASGPGLSYQWQVKDLTNGFVPVSGSMYSGATTTNLLISGASTLNNGYQYRCAISTTNGCVFYTTNATLTVNSFRYYVKPGGAAGGNGLSWATAYNDLQSALNAPKDSCGVEIWVAAGTNTAPSAGYAMTNNTAIYGGFAGWEQYLEERNWKTNLTVFKASSSYVFRADGTFASINSSARLDGVVVEGSRSSTSSRGLYTGPSADISIYNCTFRSNYIAIECWVSSPTVYGCAFESNGRDQNNNLATTGGMYIRSTCSPVVDHCIFRANSGSSGACYATTSGGSPVLKNSVFTGNYSSGGGALGFTSGSSATIYNCTIAGNRSDSSSGAGIAGASTTQIYNSIISSNRTQFGGITNETAQVTGSGITISNSCIQNMTNTAYAGKNNTSAIPSFVAAVDPSTAPTTNGDFNLTPCSALIDAGSPLFLAGATTDVAGSPRVYGAAVDMGAYESQQISLLITTNPVDQSGDKDVPVQFTAAANYTNVTYQWQVNTGAGFTNLIDNTIYSGSTNSTLVLTNETTAMNSNQYRCRIVYSASCQAFSSSARFIYHETINDSPTNIVLSATNISEAAAIGTTIGTLTVTDPDFQDSATCSLVGGAGATDNASFTIVSNVLKTAATLNYEAKTSMSIRVRATDVGGLFFEKVFTISIINVNDEYPIISGVVLVFAQENSTNALTTFTATDPDPGDSITWSLSGVDATNFTINASGLLRLITPVDYENPRDQDHDNVYQLNVLARDTASHTSQVAIAVSIINVYDGPVFTSTPVTNVASVDTYSYSVTASHPLGLPITYSAPILPPWLSLVYGQAVTTFAGGNTCCNLADGTGTNAAFNYPRGIAINSAGVMYVVDNPNKKIRKITPAGVVTTESLNPGNPFFIGVGPDTNSYYYFEYDTQSIKKVTSGTVVSSYLMPYCYSIAVDSSDVVYFARNGLIGKITGGVASDIAGVEYDAGTADGVGSDARFSYYCYLSVDNSGNLIVSDTSNHRIRKIALATRTVTTLAGNDTVASIDGVGTNASLWYPGQITVDSSGNVYFGEDSTQKIRKISTAGVVSTYAGVTGGGYVNGPAEQAAFSSIAGLAFNQAGNLFVSDLGNKVIRKIQPSTMPTLKGVAGESNVGMHPVTLMISDGSQSTNQQFTILVQSSTVNVSNVNFDGPDKSLVFGGISGRTYRVETSSDLKVWVDVGPATEISPGVFSFQENGIADKTRFYRIVTQ